MINNLKVKPKRLGARTYVVFVVITVLVFLTVQFFPNITNFGNDSDFSPEFFSLEFEKIHTDLNFNFPVDYQIPAQEHNLAYIVEQSGKIFQINEQTGDMNVFIDLSDKIIFGGEMGLLGLAFHPDFLVNGYFYVDYTAENPRRTVIARYTASPDNSFEVELNSEKIILEVNQPYNNHNGGAILFGQDGFLYIGLGDGGGFKHDPDKNGQNLETLLGSILRIDVDTVDDVAYEIPGDNPFVSNSNNYREEIFAYGLRNPWKMSLNKLTGDIYVGDVGENQYEEIDLLIKGGNYGWDEMEGFHCASPLCDVSSYELPIAEYDHKLGIAVVGGYVVRNIDSKLNGHYVYGDYGSGRIWSFEVSYDTEPSIKLIQDTNLLITSFGITTDGELRIILIDDSGRGTIYRLI